MLVTSIKIYPIRCYEQPSLEEVLVDCLPILAEGAIVAISSELVSLCEGGFVYCDNANKADLADFYILQPSDPHYTANRTRMFLAKHYGLKNVGVIITDDTNSLSWRDVLAYSGFRLAGNGNNKKASLDALADGGEATQLAVITNAPFVEFVQHDPGAKAKS